MTGSGLIGAAADERAQSREQFSQVERLDHIIIRAGVESAHAVADWSRAVSMSTGVFLVLRRRFRISQPSIFGSITSSTMAS